MAMLIVVECTVVMSNVNCRWFGLVYGDDNVTAMLMMIIE